jgi:hypothetical protein
MTADCSLLVHNPSELVAAVPFLLGYHPSDSVAVVALAGRAVEFAACADLPPPDSEVGRADLENLAETVARQCLGPVVVVGYGKPQRVTPVVLRLAQTVQMLGMPVRDVLRVTDGRWWSYLCDELRCCSDEGTPCLPGDSVIAAEATFRGIVALPSRKDLVAQVAPVDGADRESMVAATEQARKRFTDLIADDLEAGPRKTGPQRYGRLIRKAGRTAVREAEQRCRAGESISDDEAAWLGVLLVDQSVADYALSRTEPSDWRIRLWTEVLRRMEPAYVAVPACLLGFAAWRAGRGSLARVAVDRALAEEPEHRFAGLMHEVLGFGIGPHMLVTPKKGRRTRRRR